MTCQYCGGEAHPRNSKIVYGKDYGTVWVCENYPKCDSFVGCHPNSITPLGTLANAKLRKWRNRAHAYFDPIWKYRRNFLRKDRARRNLYKKLAGKLGIEEDDCHIAMFDINTCRKVVAFSLDIYNNDDKLFKYFLKVVDRRHLKQIGE